MLTAAIVAAVVSLAAFGFALGSRTTGARLPRSFGVEVAPRRDSNVLDDAILAGREDRAVAAALLDLAVRRRLRLSLGTGAGDPLTAVVATVIDGVELAPHERELLDAVFGPGAPRGPVRLGSTAARRRARRVRRLLRDRGEQLTHDGLLAGWRHGRDVLRLLAVAVLLTATASLVAGLVAGDAATIGCSLLALVAAVAALTATPAGRARWFTRLAREPRRHLDGIRRYLLLLADDDRIAAMQSSRPDELTEQLEGRLPADAAAARFRRNERLLPYAVLFGVERRWVADLQRDAGRSPSWNLGTIEILEVLDVAEDLFRVSSAVALHSLDRSVDLAGDRDAAADLAAEFAGRGGDPAR